MMNFMRRSFNSQPRDTSLCLQKAHQIYA